VRIKFPLCNILLALISIWNDVYDYVQKHFLKEQSCALQVFLCALISRPVCACTRARLRGNIALNRLPSNLRPELYIFSTKPRKQKKRFYFPNNLMERKRCICPWLVIAQTSLPW